MALPSSEIARMFAEKLDERGEVWVDEISAWLVPQEDGTHRIKGTVDMRVELGKYIHSIDAKAGFTESKLASTIKLLDIYQTLRLKRMKERYLAFEDGWLNAHTFEFVPFAEQYDTEVEYEAGTKVRFGCYQYKAKTLVEKNSPPSAKKGKWKRQVTTKHIALLSFPFKWSEVEEKAKGTERWLKFLSEVFVTEDKEPNDELIAMVSYMVGYCFMPHLEGNRIFFLAGPTASNGKSTFLKILEKLFPPEFVAKMKFKQIVSNSGTNWDKADLVGKKLLICNEEQSKDINASELKEMSDGMTSIRAVRKYQDPFDLYPAFTTICSFNTPPQFDRVDSGILRRFLYLPCLNIFDGTRNIREIVESVLEERVGIMALSLLKARELAEMNWKFPEESVMMKNAKEEYLVGQNSALDFARQNYVPSEKAKGFPIQEIYDEYVEDCSKKNNKPFALKNFALICHTGILGKSYPSNGTRYRRCVRRLETGGKLDI